MLRLGGYKPSGRGKPSSEYLVRANRAGDLPNINVAVDAANALSLHSGLPISVVDLDRLEAPLVVDTVDRASYVFNASGQEIRLDGLLCLSDAAGPRANAVKDCHATKTHAGTEAVVVVIWGPRPHASHCEAVLEAYMAVLAEAGATVERVSAGQGPLPDGAGRS
jgi:DNA/RNA-binding domain of Phe-tRNA-synthetase-like protein